MKHPSNIAHTAIITGIHRSFGIQLRSLTFLPIGEGSWSYKGTDNQQRHWFIKLARVDTSHVARITSYLHDRLGLAFVLSPLPATGIEPVINDLYLSVYPFLEGETLSYDGLTSAQCGEIARDLRMMHDAVLSEEVRRLAPQETFDRYQVSASELIAAARGYAGDDPLLLRLKAYVEARWSLIDATFVNARLLSEFCRRQSHTFVVCHADIHPFNVMQTSQGLVMIDWDGVMLAPRERDLMFYAEVIDPDSDFARAYGQDYHVERYLLSYYQYEWVLQEYADYVGRLFAPMLSPEAREDALKEFVALFGGDEEIGGVVKTALDAELPPMQN